MYCSKKCSTLYYVQYSLYITVGFNLKDAGRGDIPLQIRSLSQLLGHLSQVILDYSVRDSVQYTVKCNVQCSIGVWGVQTHTGLK